MENSNAIPDAFYFNKVCPWCAGNPINYMYVLPQATQDFQDFLSHTVECSLKHAKKYGLDIDEKLNVSDGVVIHRVEKESDQNPTTLHQERKYEFYDDENFSDEDEEDHDECSEMDDDMEDDDLEEEIKDLENDTKRYEEMMNNNGEILLKFKFVNGMYFEGHFKKTDSIGSVVEWLSVKSGLIKETIGLRFNNQTFENRKVLENKSSLEDLKVEANTEIKCISRIL